MKRASVSTLIILQEYTQGGGVYWRLTEKLKDIPPKIIWSAMQRDCAKGYIEYGMNLSAGWLTEKGKCKLQELLN